MSFADFFADTASSRTQEPQPLLDADFDTLYSADNAFGGMSEFLESNDSGEWI